MLPCWCWLSQARLSLRELKNEQKARLRQYYLEALRGTAAAAAVGVGAGREAATAAAAPPAAPALGAPSQLLVGGDEAALDPEAVQHTLGPNGLFRVSAAGAGWGVMGFGAWGV